MIAAVLHAIRINDVVGTDTASPGAVAASLLLAPNRRPQYDAWPKFIHTVIDETWLPLAGTYMTLAILEGDGVGPKRIILVLNKRPAFHGFASGSVSFDWRKCSGSAPTTAMGWAPSSRDATVQSAARRFEIHLWEA